MPGRKINRPIPPETPAELWCSRCKRNLPREAFARNRATKTGFATACTECHRENSLETRYREEIRIHGLEPFRQQTAREITIVRTRMRIAREFQDEQEAERLAIEGKSIPPELRARISTGSMRRIKASLMKQIESRLGD